MQKLKIGLAQMRCEKGEINHNLQVIEGYVRESKTNGCEIICFPEMSINIIPDIERLNFQIKPLDFEVKRLDFKIKRLNFWLWGWLSEKGDSPKQMKLRKRGL